MGDEYSWKTYQTTHENPTSALYDLYEFNREVCNSKLRQNYKINNISSEIKKLEMEFDDIYSKKILPMKTKSIELEGERNRLFRIKIPKVLQQYKREFSKFNDEIDDTIEVKINFKQKYENQMKKIRRLNEKVKELSYSDVEAKISNIQMRLNKLSGIAKRYKNTSSPSTTKSSNLTSYNGPVDELYAKLKYIKTEGADKMIADKMKGINQKISDFKDDFNQRVSMILASSKPTGNQTNVLSVVQNILESSLNSEVKIQQCYELVDDAEERIGSVTKVIADMVDSESRDNFHSLTEITNDWKLFNTNNQIVQRDADKEMYKIWNSMDNTMWRLKSCEEKINWCLLRLKLWETDTSISNAFGKENITSLDDLEAKMDEIEVMLGIKRANKNADQTKKKKVNSNHKTSAIGVPPEPQEVEYNTVEVPMKDLKLTYVKVKNTTREKVRVNPKPQPKEEPVRHHKRKQEKPVEEEEPKEVPVHHHKRRQEKPVEKPAEEEEEEEEEPKEVPVHHHHRRRQEKPKEEEEEEEDADEEEEEKPVHHHHRRRQEKPKEEEEEEEDADEEEEEKPVHHHKRRQEKPKKEEEEDAGEEEEEEKPKNHRRRKEHKPKKEEENEEEEEKPKEEEPPKKNRRNKKQNDKPEDDNEDEEKPKEEPPKKGRRKKGAA